MTLDPVHVEEIAALARLVETSVDATEQTNLADQVWEKFLDPLSRDGRAILEPVGDLRRGRVGIDKIALDEPPFPTSHGLDAGTVNPTTFRNGAVIDVAHAAMASEPSDPELHRRRTIVATMHLADRTVPVPDSWISFDEGYSRRKWLQVPQVQRFAEGVVHTLALHHAEIAHAHDNLDAVTDLFLLDGPIYPKEILRWQDRHRELREKLVADVVPGAVVQSAIDLVGACLERELPIVGFVKNPSSNRLTRAIRAAGHPAPWFNDAAFFRRILGLEGEHQLPRDQLGFTNWFISRAGTDSAFASDSSSALDLDIPAPTDAFEVTFMVIADPRTGVTYRAEAPRAVTADPTRRAALTRQLLREVAAERGPPRAIAKADSLAGISRGEKRALRQVLEQTWDTSVDRTYDDLRWGAEAE